MLSEEIGRAYADGLIDRARRRGKTVSFDVNYRTDVFRDAQSATAMYRRYIELADIVKLSEDEYEIFGAEYVDGLKDKLVCITLGSRGSEWKFGGRSGECAFDFGKARGYERARATRFTAGCFSDSTDSCPSSGRSKSSMKYSSLQTCAERSIRSGAAQ